MGSALHTTMCSSSIAISPRGGLAFLAIGVGNMIDLSFSPVQNKLYRRLMDRNNGMTIPEGSVHRSSMVYND